MNKPFLEQNRRDLENAALLECSMSSEELKELTDMELNRHLLWLRKEIETFSQDSKAEKDSKTKAEIDEWLVILFTNIHNVHKEFDRRKLNLPE